MWLSDRSLERRIQQRPIEPKAWRRCLRRYPFLPDHPRLLELSTLLLAEKEFSTVAPLQLSDDQAIAVVSQAALVILGMSLGDECINPLRRFDALATYRGFVGIVLHPAQMEAKRTETDTAGVVHHWSEPLIGEAMRGGPLTLSWHDVKLANHTAHRGQNVVVHEFVHVLDMQTGNANGVPPLPTRFRPAALSGVGPKAAYGHWQGVLSRSFDQFRERLSLSERFDQPKPWLDAYGASAPEEFFAVSAEAYFVNPQRFSEDWPEVMALYDAYFEAWRWRST